MVFVILCPGTPEGSTGSGSGFKASQKTGQRLKVSSDRKYNFHCIDILNRNYQYEIIKYYLKTGSKIMPQKYSSFSQLMRYSIYLVIQMERIVG